jgi:protein-arginine kinase activator protein McsA
MDAYKFNRNFITIIKIFNKHPNMLLNFLSKNEAFTDTFKKKLSRTVLKNKPHFTDIDKMLEYYLRMLDVQENPGIDKSLLWNNKLHNAISEQRFEDAAKIRDYMNKRGYKILI